MKTPTGYVALRKGRHVRNCIFLHWLDAEEHIIDYDEAEYSVLDSFQDAEKYIISNNNNDNNKCSPLEEFAFVAATHAKTCSTNTNNKSPLPPPLPPATIDIDDIPPVPRTAVTTNSKNANNNKANNDDNNNDTKEKSIEELIDPLSSQNSKKQQKIVAKASTKATTATLSIPIQQQPAVLQTTSKKAANTNDNSNKNKKRKRDISIDQEKQQQNKVTTTPQQTLPVKPVGHTNKNNSSINDKKVENASTPKTPTGITKTPAAGAATTTAAGTTATAATATDTSSKSKESSEILVSITGPYNQPTVVWSDATNNINKRWKQSFEHFLSYRNSVDGTFQHPIPDKNVRKWFNRQRIEYKNKIQGIKNNFTDEKEKIFRSIGVVFFSIEGFFKLPEPTTKPTQSTRPVILDDDNYKEQQEGTYSNNNQNDKTVDDSSTLENNDDINNRPKKRSRKSSQANEKKKKQDEINFNIWKDNLAKLKDYMDAHDGDWNVKAQDDENLNRWVSLQKAYFLRMKKGESTNLNDEKITMLRDIGIELDKVVYTWEERIEQLQQYKQEHGNLQIPYNHPVLGVWTQSKIRQFRRPGKDTLGPGMPKQRKLNTKQIEELNKYNLNFLNEIKARQYQMWDDEYDEKLPKLKEYKNKFGTCRVKRKYKEYTDLYRWYERIQNEYRKLSGPKKKSDTCRLSMEQMAQLTQMDFPFTEQTRNPPKTFEESIEQLKVYIRNGGDVSKIKRNHPELGDFVGRQRRDYRLWCQGEYTVLTEEKIKILESLGFTWNVENWVKPDKKKNKIKSWDERYQDLLDYKAKHGHVMVPMYEESGLGHWVKNQRNYYKLMQRGNGDGYGRSRPRITTEQALKLSNIGFIFDVTNHNRKSNNINRITNDNNNNKHLLKNNNNNNTDNDDDDDNNYNNNNIDDDFDYE